MSAYAPEQHPSVQELQAAARALASGKFRAGNSAAPTWPQPMPAVADHSTSSVSTWNAQRQVLPVLGVSGACGATSLAVALATVLAPARVLECCSMSETGLAEAATAEFGVDAHGWCNGTRAQVTVSRAAQGISGPQAVPTPEVFDDPGVDLLDVGWSLERLLATSGWLSHQIHTASTVVVAATASVPSLRRLENTLAELEPATAIVAVRSLGSKRLPAHVTAAMGPRTQAHLEHGTWVEIPHEKDLAERGLSGSALPRSLLSAAHQISRLTGAGSTTPKGLSS